VKVLVTGSAGFIGNHLYGELARRGHKVHGIDLEDIYPYEQCDARDFFRHENYRYDLVIHCAAVVGGRMKIENSPVAYAQNLELDAALFQWAERTKPGRVVYISSVAAYPGYLQYGDHQIAKGVIAGANILKEESVRLTSSCGMPDEMYGWAKLTGEYLASRSSIPVSVVRPFTVYGEGQDSIFPFANLIMQVKNYYDPVTVWGSGNQVRDFIHVDDVVNAILVMAEQGIDGPVNLCTGRGTSLNEAARMIVDEAKKILSLKNYDPEIEQLPDKTEGLPYRVGNPEKLHEFYVPRVSLEDGIERGLR
jgi:nucleoside-diphosphate-sugar epimerase